MALKCYYDGSGAPDGVVTLAGVAAPERLWVEFERQWNDVLQKHSVRSLHMTDLMAFHGEFKSWAGDHERKRSFLRDLWNVLGRFRLDDSEAHPLKAYSCSVLMQDWNRAKKTIPRLASPQSICVNFCVGSVQLPKECADEKRPLILYFDRNEMFMHKVNRVWLNRRQQPGTLHSRIRNIIATDAITDYPIQVADMLAWIANRSVRDVEYLEREAFKFASVLMIEPLNRVYDYDQILLRYPHGRLKASQP